MAKRILGDRELTSILVRAAADQTHPPTVPVADFNEKRDARVKRASAWALADFDPVRTAKALETSGLTIENAVRVLEEIISDGETSASARISAIRESRKLMELVAIGDPKLAAKVTAPVKVPEPAEELPDPWKTRHERMRLAAEG